MDKYNIGCLSFLTSSLLLTINNLNENPINKTTLVANMLFNIGCIYFIRDNNDI